jgi:hypothetical protein
MSATCYLCVIGKSPTLVSGRAAAEGFGTCEGCWVHACPRHGERLAQYFRCADCIAADPATAATTIPVPDATATAELVANAPELSARAAGVRAEADVNRMAAAIAWVNRRVRDGEGLDLVESLTEGRLIVSPLAITAQDADIYEARPVDPTALNAAAIERARLLERLAQAQLARAGLEEVPAGNGPLAVAATAIAYAARDEPSLESSPLAIAGGLRLPPMVAVLAHAYAQANHFFW